MYTYSCQTPMYQNTGYQIGGSGSNNFAFILVLFILLAIICSTSFFNGKGCCEEREARCFA